MTDLSSPGLDTPTDNPRCAPAARPLATALFVVGCGLPFVMILGLVARLAVNVPFKDEWSLVPLLQKSAAGALGLPDLWAQHNEHRSFFPELILVGISHLTKWDIRWELAGNLALAAAAFLLLSFLAWRTVAPLGRDLFAICCVTFAWFVFSPIQYENWLWGWEIAWFLCGAAAIAAVVILATWPEDRPGWLGMAAAIAAAVVSSYSLSTGLLVWFAAPIAVLARPRLRRYLGLWFGAAAATLGLYLFHYERARHQLDFLRHPIRFGLYILGYLSTPLYGSGRVKVLLGLGVIAAFILAAGYLFAFYRETFNLALGWVALGAFVFLGAVTTAIGRQYLGAAQSGSSRYTTSSMIFALSGLALAVLAIGRLRTRSAGSAAMAGRLRTALVLLIVVSLAKTYVNGVQGMFSRHRQEASGRACLQRVQGPGDPCLSLLLPPSFAESEWTDLQYLRKSGLVGLSSPATSTHPPSPARNGP